VRGPGFFKPDPNELKLFSLALARRYSGTFQDLPRVRHFQAWNEPNLKVFLAPQAENGRTVSPAIYRGLVNALADGVKQVHADNLVIAGGLAPFSLDTREADFITPPLKFMRELLCVRGRSKPKPTCAHRTRFDIWSTHPYTTGGPTQSAFRPDDVSLGDLPEMRRLLQAADRSARITAPRRVQFWVTEFSWDTNKPDPGGVPLKLHARWTSEALYRMWKSGVSVVTWFLLTDRPHAEGGKYEFEFQSGLYFRGSGDSILDAKPKPALRAFRFPFVALPERGRVLVWGRAPGGKAVTVVVERRSGAKWRRVARLRTDRNGIFQRRLRRQPGTAYRARMTQSGGAQTVAFALKAPPNRRYNPFGGPRP
jgi:5-hydroxyisourate hydrolase-like protein (transthyretin family)